MGKMPSTAFVALLLLVLFSRDVAAQACTRGSAACGVTISDSLDFESGACLDSNTLRYQLVPFTGAEGTRLIASVESSFFPPAIALLNPLNQEVVRESNAARGSKATIAHTLDRGGQWTIVVRNTAVAEGGPYTLSVICSGTIPPPRPPFELTTNPSRLEIVRGEPAQFAVDVRVNEGEAAPTFLSSGDLPAGVTVSFDPASIPSPGAGRTTATVFAGASALPGNYSVLITGDRGGFTNSTRLSLAISNFCQVPFISKQPTQTIQIIRGRRAQLAIEATGSVPLSYQWYLGGVGSRFFPIANATGPELTTDPILSETSYWVEVKNHCGTRASNTITLIPVNPPPRRRAARRM